MYIKYILSILILASTLFSANIRVIESYDIPSTKTINKKIYKKKLIKKSNYTNKKIYKKQNIKLTTKSSNKKVHAKKIISKSTSSQIKKGKLLIIIDDVSNMHQLKTIQNLPFKVTPSIFPPTNMNMKSYKLAKGLKHFMIHLPLESHSKQMNTIYKVIRTNYTQKQIDSRIKEIRKLFPNGKYINNHTGSKFTANYSASKKLYKSLISNGFIFLDSRTSSKTKIPKLAREYNKRYLRLDLFIDNVVNTNRIKKEIKKAISLAKRQGFAVVIGHPHPQTMRALKELSSDIKSLNTVYIDEF